MKYIVVLIDGAADEPSAPTYKTPLECAYKPNIDEMAKKGVIGTVATVPEGMAPGSDVANLSVMGYDPLKYYTGRSPLEALSMGVKMTAQDVAVRCNLVTLSDDGSYADKTMVDYSAGEISSRDADLLINELQDKLGDNGYAFYSGVSYRHCMLMRNNAVGTCFTPPHDITGRKIRDYLPQGINGESARRLMEKSCSILSRHPVNTERIKRGDNPANGIWLWGEGTMPRLPSFERLYGLKAGVISAVDLLKGIGIAAGMKIYNVSGATGTLNTDFSGKARAAIDALNEVDYVYVHLEAPDECSHQGDVSGKIRSIELIDELVVGEIKSRLDAADIEYSMLILPDHPTPLAIRTHTGNPVPFVYYKSGADNAGAAYTEKNAKESGLFYGSGEALATAFLQEQI